MEHAHFFLENHGHWYWIVPILFMIVMLVFGSLMCRRMRTWRRFPAYTGRGGFACCGPNRGFRSDSRRDAPGQILDLRYANGEITKEERDLMKRELDSNPTSSESEAG